MMTHFYFVLTNVEVESILKEEIRLRYPELRLSYSRPGFITFKGDNDIRFNPLFCRLSGISHGKFKKHELKYEKAWVYPVNDKLEVPEDLKMLSEKSVFKKGETVTLIIMAGHDEFWLGTYTLQSHHFQTPGEVSSILEQDVPSRAYYKIAEAFEAFDLPFDHQERVLELGSAPGGASLFLLEQDLKVLGVDPADMDPRVTKNIDFKHIRKPFETLIENDFKTGVDWIISDINLPPTVVLKEVFRLLTFLEPRGLLITLKMNDMKHLEVMANIRDQMRKQGFRKVELKYFPSHKKEICLLALHE
jgi:23S rRNA U2552 (ribose-2'-O)-methylase RlmE/FtsJ